jgi:hypothetical protein
MLRDGHERRPHLEAQIAREEARIAARKAGQAPDDQAPAAAQENSEPNP